MRIGYTGGRTARSARPGVGRTALAGAVLIAALAATGACSAVDATQRTVDRAGTVNALASRLDQASDDTYTADYTAPGGARTTVVQAQDPLRVAYLFPTGRYVLTHDAVTACVDGSCELRPAMDPGNQADVTALGEAGGRGFVPPTRVLTLLTAAALDPDAAVATRDTRIAGRPASCVRVTDTRSAPNPDFDACITADGVLGSFSGSVDGTRIDLRLTRYVRDAAAADAFGPPAGARITDVRDQSPR